MTEQLQGYRIAPQQKRIWRMEQNDGFRARVVVALTGNHDVATVAAAVTELAARHETLHTLFKKPPGLQTPLQVPAAPEVAWREFAADEMTACLADHDAPFDVANGPIVRAGYVAGDAHGPARLVLTVPALNADAWSLGVIVAELDALVQARQGGPRPEEEVVQYSQFSEWTLDLNEEEDYEAASDFWAQRLGAVTATPSLPGAKRDGDRFRPRQVERRVEAAPFEAAAAALGTTLEPYLLSCWLVYLSRICAETHLTCAAAFHGREFEELQSAVGPFLRFLPITLQLAEHLPSADIVRQVIDLQGECDRRQDYYELRGATLPSGGFGFAFMPLPADTGIFQIEQLDHVAETFALKLDVLAGADQTLHLRLDYDGALFDTDQGSRLLLRFETLLRDAAARTEAAVGTLAVLPAEERHRLTALAGGDPTEQGHFEAVHRLFERQAAHRPDAVALVCENAQLSYDELNRRANRTAAYLRSVGADRDTPVAICLGRSPEFASALLGALKAGACYLPLDPDLPAKRLAYMVSDSDAVAVLTDDAHRPAFAECKVPVIALDREGAAVIAEFSSANPTGASQPGDLAYLIYTSGSTGTPKAVGVTHHNIWNYTLGVTQRFGLDTTRSFALVSSLAADLGNTALYPAFCGGGTLHLFSNETLADPLLFAAAMSQHQIDFLKITPTHLMSLMNHDHPEQVLPRKALALGGEATSWELVETLRRLAPELAIHNHYGPTEATVGVATYTYDGSRCARTFPLGQALPGSACYVLNSTMALVPPGTPGELYIGGAGVARGYRNRDDLTQERFVPDPFQPARGARLYRSGDLVRRTDDGYLEFVGRVDHQVKIRGFRVELGEIEHQLTRHAKVREAVVTAITRDSGNTATAGYVVPRGGVGGGNALIDELRAWLSDHLPAYMVPAHLIVLDQMPLNPNGKIDRKALPDPSRSQGMERPYTAPRTPIEQILADLWSEILEVERVGIHDDFFELGGHSIFATQTIFQVRKRFNVSLTLPDFFNAATVAKLAERILAPDAGSGRLDPAQLPAEVVLDQAVAVTAALKPAAAQPAVVLLTGVTGFLGAFLLDDLLRRTNAKVVCLVRANDDAGALHRIVKTWAQYEIEHPEFTTRVVALAGDLARPRLGLKADVWRRLSAEVDMILHNGALVNFTYPYNILKAPNVLGTVELLKLATVFKLKPLHFVSTSSVFAPEAYAGRDAISEDDPVDQVTGLDGGYAQSKWVAEQIVMLAGKRGVPVTIHRPGRIMGHSVSGACTTGDLLCRMLKGCEMLGAAPASPMPMQMLPVDYVSAAIVHLCLAPSSHGKAFHIKNPAGMSLDAMADWMRDYGYALRSVGFDAWRREIVDAIQGDTGHPLYPFLVMFAEGASAADSAKELATPPLATDNTQRGLAGSGIICPAVTGDLLRTYFDYFVRIGFLPSPAATNS